MKIYFNDDEDIYDTESEEEEEIFNMKPREKTPVSKTSKFNTEDFDYKVARSIVEIHRKKRTDDKFSKWVEENFTHLNALYRFSNMECSENEFYNYIYENSKIF